MKLTHEQIKSIALGASYVEESDEKTVFHRFTKEQEELYKTVKDSFYNKTFSSSCIRLEFKTDSKSLFIKTLITPRSSRTFYSIDTFVDGKLVGAIKGNANNSECNIAEGCFTLGDSKTQKNVRIHLPWSCSADIIEISIDDGATLCPVKKSRRMIMYGDSITQGYDADLTSNSYASQLSISLDAEARNKGIGGEVFRPELARLKDNDFEPDIITVAYGTNDWSDGISEIELEDKVDKFLSAIANNYPKAKIFFIAPIWRGDYTDYRPFGSFLEIRSCFYKVISKYPSASLIDGFDFVPKDSSLFSDKYLHPNDEGFSHYAKNLTDKLIKLL